MFRSLRRRLTFANVCSALALFVALGTGGAYAANTIGSADVIDESLLSREVKNGTLTPDDIATNSIGSGRIQDNSLVGGDIRDGTLQGRDVAPDTLTGQNILESSLGQVPSAAAAQSADFATQAG